jgi:hypothetical protein
MAIKGENPDHSSFGANISLQAVCNAIRMTVKAIKFLLIFI